MASITFQTESMAESRDDMIITHTLTHTRTQTDTQTRLAHMHPHKGMAHNNVGIG